MTLIFTSPAIILFWLIPSLFFISSFQYSLQLIKFADDWIRTADLWGHKQLLYQLRHNHSINCATTTAH